MTNEKVRILHSLLHTGLARRTNIPITLTPLHRSMSAMASLEKSRNSLQTGVSADPLFMPSCVRSPVMLT
jgi:hypothetical protein